MERLWIVARTAQVSGRLGGFGAPEMNMTVSDNSSTLSGFFFVT